MPLYSRHTIAVALFAASLPACALETAGLGSRDDGALDGGASSDAAIDAVSTGTADAATFLADANAIDATDGNVATPDAWTPADAGDAGGPCDLDNDGHRQTGTTCSGDDCCDSDPRVHPGQTTFFVTRNACGTFDYDCNGQENLESGSADCKLGFFTCSGDGFAASTACGVTATYTSCAWAGFSCNHNDDMRQQRCR